MDLNDLPTAWDAISADELRDVGSVKWTAHPGAIGAFVAEMDFGIAPGVEAALVEALRSGFTGYLPGALEQRLQVACAAWQQRHYGWSPAADDVHAVPDVVAAAEFAVRHLSRPDTPVIVPTPAYMPFLRVPEDAGRRVVQVPSVLVDGRETLDLDRIARAFADGAHLLLLTNPWNPIGRVLDRGELAALADVVEAAGGFVFADEIHAPLTAPGVAHVPYASVSAAAAWHSVTATSASKAFNLAGFKCAQLIVTSDPVREVWEREGRHLAHGTATIGVVAAVAAYETGAPWLDVVRGYLDRNRRTLGELLVDALPEVGYVPPEGTYIGWLDARALGLAEPPAAFFLREAGVAMTDGAACGAAGEGFLRFVFALPTPLVEQAVARMAQAVRRCS